MLFFVAAYVNQRGMFHRSGLVLLSPNEWNYMRSGPSNKNENWLGEFLVLGQLLPLLIGLCFGNWHKFGKAETYKI